MVRIGEGGAYANLVLPKMLAQSGLPDRDRAFVTQLVYGTTRMARACDWFVDRYAHGELEPAVRAALRLGTYQLRFLATPAHAAVSATVDTVPRRARGLVNAVLRKVADADDAWPSTAVELSYPDWIYDRLSADLGSEAHRAMVAMNSAASVHERDDGYIQDPASQQVTEAIQAEPGHLVLDLCAAPGGKATALAASGATVVAADRRARRVGLIVENRDRLAPTGALPVLVADGVRPPFPDATFDRVLVDAPCSGLGSLRRRADARWRIGEDAPERLSALQRKLLDAAAPLVKPGGVLVYSVCTLTAVETTGVAETFSQDHPGWMPVTPPSGPWQPWGTGSLLLPQAIGSDGMAWFGWRAPSNQP